MVATFVLFGAVMLVPVLDDPHRQPVCARSHASRGTGDVPLRSQASRGTPTLITTAAASLVDSIWLQVVPVAGAALTSCSRRSGMDASVACLRAPTVAFLGWFGPRGLASIVFAVILVEEANLANETLLLSRR
jgi:NhaP-type Na+/H+ or K+/H+ antiporter